MTEKLGGFSGLFLGLLAIFGAFFLDGGSLRALFLIPPLFVVFGGTFAAVIIGFGFEKFREIFYLARLAYFPRNYNYPGLIFSFIDFSVLARREGILSLEKELDKLEYEFPKKLIKLVIDGTDPENLENIALSGMKSMQERHFSNIFIFTKMGGYAPTMGILGTVMGLVMTLANAGGDPNILIHNIATAFIATLWGVLSANLFWLPIADRLRQCHLEEKHMMQISLEGVLTLQSGEIPSVMKARLLSLLPQQEEKRLTGLAEMRHQSLQKKLIKTDIS